MNELLEEFTDWLDEGGGADVDALVSHAETFLDWRANTPLETLDDAAIRAFLLEWCPRQLSLPAEESGEVCEAVTEFICFLGSTRRLRGGTDQARGLMRTAVGLEPAMCAAMDDPANYGMAKSLFASIEGAESMTANEMRAAMQQRVDEHNALPLEQRKALTDGAFGYSQPTMKLPFLHVPPPQAEVVAAAAGAALPGKVQALCDYLGEPGKALTATGQLKLADGRALVDILDTGDTIDPTIGDTTFKTHTTANLRQLMYFVTVAEASGAVRYVKNRLVPVKAWTRQSPIGEATKLFHTIIEYGVLSTMPSRMSFYTELHGMLDAGMPHWLAGLLAPGVWAEFADILELNERVVLGQFGSDAVHYYVSAGPLADDVSRILEILELTGAIEWADRAETATRWGRRVYSGGTITMTAFGRHVLPDYLPAAGIMMRTAIDLTEVDLTDLISAMDSIPEAQHSTLVAAWQPSLPVSERAGIVAALVTESDDARARLVGLRMLGMFDGDVAEPHMRQLLDTAAAGHAAIWLLDHGLADGDTVGGFITPAIMVDILSQLLDHPAALCEQFLGGHDPYRMLEFFWRHPAPETAAVLDVLGRHLPDPALAKQARKSAIKHRSWMANGSR